MAALKARVGVAPEESQFDAKHRLFVEGSGSGARDCLVLRELLNIHVEPLGHRIQ